MTETDAERLGQLIRTGRQAKGWSTPQLAVAIGVNQSTIVRLENGKIAQPDAGLLQRVAQILDIRLTDLYARAGIPLPSLQPYLRAQYGLSDADTARVQTYIQRLAAAYGADGSGPADGADELPDDQ